MALPSRPQMFHIPVCPFSQRVEIVLGLKGETAAVDFHVVDITKPRSPELLAKTRGTTALPVLELEDGTVLKESLVLMDFFEDRFSARPVRQQDPTRRAVERMMTLMERDFVPAGYRYVLNQNAAKRDGFKDELLAQYRALDAFLTDHSPRGTFLFEDFGWVEAVFTPMFQRFWFLEYYEGFELPDAAEYARVRTWRDACIQHPRAQQVTKEAIVKLYYDYAKGAGNGALLPGRTRSSFVFEPRWEDRPWPPTDKYGRAATDGELGL